MLLLFCVFLLFFFYFCPSCFNCKMFLRVFVCVIFVMVLQYMFTVSYVWFVFYSCISAYGLFCSGVVCFHLSLFLASPPKSSISLFYYCFVFYPVLRGSVAILNYSFLYVRISSVLSVFPVCYRLIVM